VIGVFNVIYTENTAHLFAFMSVFSLNLLENFTAICIMSEQSDLNATIILLVMNAIKKLHYIGC